MGSVLVIKTTSKLLFFPVKKCTVSNYEKFAIHFLETLSTTFLVKKLFVDVCAIITHSWVHFHGGKGRRKPLCANICYSFMQFLDPLNLS